MSEMPAHRLLKLFMAMVLVAGVPLVRASDVAELKAISWAPAQLESGSPCLFKVELENGAASVTGKWLGRDLSFFNGKDLHTWYALGGVDVETNPGNYQLTVDVTTKDGKVVHSDREVSVALFKYRTSELHVPDKFVAPDPATLKRIEAEKAIKNAAFAHETPTPEWSGDFRAPLDSAPTDSFGTRRVFNGKVQSVHRGTDFRAPSGTPVTAANSGEVVLARSFFYEGNFVVIDHGQNFMTMYMHLSEIQVVEGQKLKKGQQIGLSGATGRATGPHLHMAVRWRDEYLDPAQLLKLTLPSL
jgi:murein DD-endopeptidase MepM/ murein hydrolase activator NlpD